MFTCFSNWLTKYRGRFKGDFQWSEWILSGSWGIYDYWIIKLNVMQNILSHVIVGFFFFCSMLMVLTNIYVYISAFVFIFDHFAAVLMVFYCINSKCIYFTSKHFFFHFLSYHVINISHVHIIHESWVLHLCYHLINSWKFYYYQTAIISFLG